MDARISRPVLPAADVYTDVNSLQNLKAEKNQDAALKKIAQQFESMFLHEMIKTMRKANEVFEEDSLFNGGDTQFFRDMYDQQLSLSLAQKGTGLAQSIFQQLSRQYAQSSATENPDNRSDFSIENLQRVHTPPAVSTKQSVVEEADVVPAKLNVIEQNTPAAKVMANEKTVFESAQEFVTAVLPYAKAAAGVLGVNPLFLTAQAALETGWGKHVIRDGSGASTHNLFNIKADRGWQGEKTRVSTLEYRGGVPVKEQANFRKYPDFAESFADYVRFLQDNPRYQDALAATGGEAEFAMRLQQAGYATDPQYANKIMTILQQLSSDPKLAAAQ